MRTSIESPLSCNLSVVSKLDICLHLLFYDDTQLYIVHIRKFAKEKTEA